VIGVHGKYTQYNEAAGAVLGGKFNGTGKKER
jgi:hypothetical protein